MYLFVLNYKSRWVLGVLTGPPLNTLISAHCVEKLKRCEFFGRNLLRCQGSVFCAFCCLPKLDLFPLKLNCLNIHSFWLGGVLSGLVGVFMMGLLAANSSPPCFGLVFGSLGGVCLWWWLGDLMAWIGLFGKVCLNDNERIMVMMRREQWYWLELMACCCYWQAARDCISQTNAHHSSTKNDLKKIENNFRIWIWEWHKIL